MFVVYTIVIWVFYFLSEHAVQLLLTSDQISDSPLGNSGNLTQALLTTIFHNIEAHCSMHLPAIPIWCKVDKNVDDGKLEQNQNLQEEKTKIPWYYSEVEAYANVISNYYIKSWTGVLCNSNFPDSSSENQPKKDDTKVNHMSSLSKETIAQDLQEELQYLLSGIADKVKIISKTSILFDLLQIVQCHMKRIKKVISGDSKCDGFKENDVLMNFNFEYCHWIYMDSIGTQTPNCGNIDSRSETNKIAYLEVLAQNLLTSFKSKKDNNLNASLVCKILAQIITHQIFVPLIDLFSSPNILHEYVSANFTFEDTCHTNEASCQQFDSLLNKQSQNALIHWDNPSNTSKGDKLTDSGDKDSNTEVVLHKDKAARQISNSQDKNCPKYEQQNLQPPNTVNLTGYQVRTSNQTKNLRCPTIKVNNHGSGKISNALGKPTY